MVEGHAVEVIGMIWSILRCAGSVALGVVIGKWIMARSDWRYGSYGNGYVLRARLFCNHRWVRLGDKEQRCEKCGLYRTYRW